jgi:hypothetical protein
MFVKPAPGLVIRDPDLLDLLPADGRAVPDSGYWQRRVRDGDVVEAPPIDTSSVVEATTDNQPLKGDD